MVAQTVSEHPARGEASPFARWLREAMEGRPFRQVAEYVEMSPTSIRNLALGLSEPSLETCFKLASYFRVDAARVGRLAGYDVPTLEETQQILSDPAVDLAFRTIGQELSPEGQRSVLEYAQFVLARERAMKQD